LFLEVMMFTKEIEQFLTEMTIPLRLSCVTDSGWPVGLSLWYLYEKGHLYCATQAKAKVVDYLEQDSRCAFEVAGDQPPYRGVRGQATAVILPDRGLEILERLLVRYLGDTDNLLAQKLLSRSTPEVAIRITPVNLSTWDFTKRMKDSVPAS
jgi:nitroimidazol reductase NimA-like FMN-containing flavoprotein (pyridoxamine 5'-phosphate oxidase superfamily)